MFADEDDLAKVQKAAHKQIGLALSEASSCLVLGVGFGATRIIQLLDPQEQIRINDKTWREARETLLDRAEEKGCNK